MKKTLMKLTAMAVLGWAMPGAWADSYCAPAPKAAASYVGYCAPTLVKTVEMNRCRVKRMGYDKCGKCYTYWVTVVTYKAIYSNGSWKTYSKSYLS